MNKITWEQRIRQRGLGRVGVDFDADEDADMDTETDEAVPPLEQLFPSPPYLHPYLHPRLSPHKTIGQSAG